jgi:hypothetical protein
MLLERVAIEELGLQMLMYGLKVELVVIALQVEGTRV